MTPDPQERQPFKVVCIDNELLPNSLTVGKEYDALDCDGDQVKIVADTGRTGWFYLRHFEKFTRPTPTGDEKQHWTIEMLLDDRKELKQQLSIATDENTALRAELAAAKADPDHILLQRAPNDARESAVTYRLRAEKAERELSRLTDGSKALYVMDSEVKAIARAVGLSENEPPGHVFEYAPRFILSLQATISR
jgi:hypothetical protein